MGTIVEVVEGSAPATRPRRLRSGCQRASQQGRRRPPNQARGCAGSILPEFFNPTIALHCTTAAVGHAPQDPCCGRPSTALAAAPSQCPPAPAQAPRRSPLTACGPFATSIGLRGRRDVCRGCKHFRRWVEGTEAPVGWPDYAARKHRWSHLVGRTWSWCWDASTQRGELESGGARRRQLVCSDRKRRVDREFNFLEVHVSQQVSLARTACTLAHPSIPPWSTEMWPVETFATLLRSAKCPAGRSTLNTIPPPPEEGNASFSCQLGVRAPPVLRMQGLC